MDQFNLLDFDNDVLNIIGDYVKKDNHERMEKEEDFNYADEGIEYLKKNNQFIEENINEMIYDRLFKRGRSRNDIEEYRTTRNFN
jgi:hypothetical protein